MKGQSTYAFNIYGLHLVGERLMSIKIKQIKYV